MKTEDLIKLMAEDTSPPVSPSKALLQAGVLGALLAAAAFFVTLGPRDDIGRAIETVRFSFKFVVMLSLLAAAGSLVNAIIRPGSDISVRRWLLLIAPALLILGVVVELIVTPSGDWISKLIGQNALHCLVTVPLLSIFPSVFLFLAMRHGAPENPGVAGAVAGLLSAGIAATLYASNCSDDSPLFVATWYSIATLFVAGTGYWAGRRFLRW